MTITSLAFAGFAAFVLAIYYLLPHRWQNGWLLVASYVFYATFSLHFVAILIALTLFNYVLARRIRPRDPAHRWLRWVGIAVNVGVWVFFKIAGFFLPEV